MVIGASKELKEIVIESGHMAESLFERVNDGYHELTVSKKYMTNCTPKIIKYYTDKNMGKKAQLGNG